MSYKPDLTQAIRHALYRLRWKLGRSWGNRVVLVGGLAPPFLVPHPASGVDPHVGTSDIDLAIGLFAPEEEAYVSLVRALKDCGYEQRQPEEPSFRWFGQEDDVEIILEILCPESEEIQRRIRRKVETDGGSDLTALQVRGVELAARDFVTAELNEEVTDLGDRGSIELRVVGPTTLIALKAQALADVDKAKHAYDIVWICDAWPHAEKEPNGVGALAKVVLSSGVSEDRFIVESFRVLANLFESPISPGPVGYSEMMGGEAADVERARLYAHGIVVEFLDAIS